VWLRLESVGINGDAHLQCMETNDNEIAEVLE